MLEITWIEFEITQTLFETLTQTSQTLILPYLVLENLNPALPSCRQHSKTLTQPTQALEIPTESFLAPATAWIVLEIASVWN